jgi:hypothetical protein
MSERGRQKVKDAQNDGRINLQILEQHNEGKGTVVLLKQLPDVSSVLFFESE